MSESLLAMLLLNLIAVYSTYFVLSGLYVIVVHAFTGSFDFHRLKIACTLVPVGFVLLVMTSFVLQMFERFPLWHVEIDMGKLAAKKKSVLDDESYRKFVSRTVDEFFEGQRMHLDPAYEDELRSDFELHVWSYVCWARRNPFARLFPSLCMRLVQYKLNRLSFSEFESSLPDEPLARLEELSNSLAEQAATVLVTGVSSSDWEAERQTGILIRELYEQVRPVNRGRASAFVHECEVNQRAIYHHGDRGRHAVIEERSEDEDGAANVLQEEPSARAQAIYRAKPRDERLRGDRQAKLRELVADAEKVREERR